MLKMVKLYIKVLLINYHTLSLRVNFCYANWAKNFFGILVNENYVHLVLLAIYRGLNLRNLLIKVLKLKVLSKVGSLRFNHLLIITCISGVLCLQDGNEIRIKVLKDYFKQFAGEISIQFLMKTKASLT